MRSGLDLLAKQPRDGGGLAQRPARRAIDAPHDAVDAEENGGERTRAFLVAREHVAQVPRQREQRRLDVVARDDALHEAPLGDIGGRLEARRNGALGQSQHGVEAREHLRAETRGDGRARAMHDVADALEARLRQRARDVRLDAQRGDRQQRHGARQRLEIALRQNAFAQGLGAIARQRPCGFRRVGKAGAGAVAGEPVLDERGERRLAAEQMRRARDVEHEAVGRVAGRKRREPAAPVGDQAETLFPFGLRLLTRPGGRRLRPRRQEEREITRH